MNTPDWIVLILAIVAMVSVLENRMLSREVFRLREELATARRRNLELLCELELQSLKEGRVQRWDPSKN